MAGVLLTDAEIAALNAAGVDLQVMTGDLIDDIEAGRHLVRWAFCKEPSVIEEALGRLAAADLAYG